MNFDQFNKFLKNNSPTIISGAAVAGVITTAVLTHRAAIQAHKRTNQAVLHHEVEETDDGGIDRRDVARITWKFYIPPVASGAATIACIVWANRIGLQRNAALIAAYALAEGAFREYKDQVVEQFGKKEEAKVTDAVAASRLERDQPGPTVVVAGGDEQLCYDMFTGRYFRSDIETIRQAVNLVNAAIINGNMYACLNEFYGFLGMDSVAVGEVVGWNVDNLCDVTFSSHMSETGRVALAMSFAHLPKADFGKCF